MLKNLTSKEVDSLIENGRRMNKVDDNKLILYTLYCMLSNRPQAHNNYNEANLRMLQDEIDKRIYER